MIRARSGFTLVEVILVIVIVAILATVALRSAAIIGAGARTEEAKRELEALSQGIVGNPEIRNVGVRVDFGYVGDVGALPPDFDALRTNPGLGTWRGPYVVNELVQEAGGFKTDPWGKPYTRDGVNLISSSPDGPIVKKLAGAESELLRNRVAGVVLDADGTPPGAVYSDSIEVALNYPNGGGGTTTRIGPTDGGGYFTFDSIPIGNHDLQIVYVPESDTVHRFVTVPPGAMVYTEYFLAENYWSSGGSGSATGLGVMSGSDTLTTANCYKLVVWITNQESSPAGISSVKVTWTGPTAYFQNVYWDGVQVRGGNPALTSGSTATFTSAQTLGAGEAVQVRIEEFHANSNGGGPPVDMSGAEFTLEFSDGSSVTFTADNCRP